MASHKIIIEIRIIANQIATGLKNVANQVNSNFGSMNAKMKQFTTDVGGMSSAIRATSGVLRAMGTAGFLVGGQFRTLGFALSASSSLLQNFGPILLNVVTSLAGLGAGLGPVILAIGAAGIAIGVFAAHIAVAIGEMALFVIGLAKIVQIGFDFNSQYESSVVNIGALVDQLFTLRTAEKEVLEGQRALNASFVIADEQLKKLRIDALTTKFTFQQLFTSLQAGVAASAGTVGTLDDIRDAVVGLTRLGAARGIDAGQLAQSITQAFLGTLRVTNKLKSSLADVFGVNVPDLNNYIKKLRAAGTLFTELNKKLIVFNLAGKAQAETFVGVINNLQDAIQIFSADVSKKAFTVIRNGLNEMLSIAFDFSQKDFTPPFLKLIDVLGNILDIIAKDLIGSMGDFLGRVGELADALEKNEIGILKIWEGFKLTVSEAFKLLGALGSMFGLTTGIGTNVDRINAGLETIATIFEWARGVLNRITILIDIVYAALLGLNLQLLEIARTINYILTLGGLLGRGELDSLTEKIEGTKKKLEELRTDIVNRWKESEDAVDGVTNKFQNLNDTLGETISLISDEDLVRFLSSPERLGISNDHLRSLTKEKALRDDIKTLTDEQIQLELDRLKLGTEIPFSEVPSPSISRTQEFAERRASALKNEQEIRKEAERTKDQNVTLTRRRIEDEKADNAKRLRSVLAAQLQANKEIIGLDKDKAKDILDTLRDRLKFTADLEQNQLDDNLISINEYYDRLQNLRNLDFNAQKIYQLKLFELNKELLVLDLQSIKDEKDEIREEILQAKADNKPTGRLQGQLEAADTRAKVLRLKFDRQQEDIQNNILNIGREQLQDTQKLTRERVIQNQQLAEELRLLEVKTREQFDTESLTAVANQFREFVEDNQTLFAQLDKLKSVDSEDAEETLALVGIELSQTERILVLTRTRLNYEAGLNRLVSSRVPFEMEEEAIQARISAGVIDQIEGQNQLAINRRKEADALEKVVAGLEEEVAIILALNEGVQNSFTTRAIQDIQRLKIEIFNLRTVTEESLLAASDNARSAFSTFFEDLQTNIDDARSAFASLAQSILQSFRKLLADKIVRDLFGEKGVFGKLLSPEGQTTDKATGWFAGFLRWLGLDSNSKAAALNPKTLPTTKIEAGVLSPDQERKIAGILEDAQKIRAALDVKAQERTIPAEKEVSTQTEGVQPRVVDNDRVFTAGSPVGLSKLGKVEVYEVTIDDGNLARYTDMGDGSFHKRVVTPDGQPIKTIPDETVALTDLPFTRAKDIKQTHHPAIAKPDLLEDAIKRPELKNIILDTFGPQALQSLNTLTTPLAVIRDTLTNFGTYLTQLIGVIPSVQSIDFKFDATTGQIVSAIESISSGQGGGEENEEGDALGGILSSVTILLNKIKTNESINASQGRFIRGPGTSTSDSIPAMLSDGEFVLRASAVKKLGVGFLHSLNSIGKAGGGTIQKLVLGDKKLKNISPINLKAFEGKFPKNTTELTILLSSLLRKPTFKTRKDEGDLMPHLAGGGILSSLFGGSGFLSKIFGGGKGLKLLLPALPAILGMFGGKKSKISGSLLSLLFAYLSKNIKTKDKKVEGGLIQHFNEGGSVLNETNLVPHLIKGRTVSDLNGFKGLLSQLFGKGAKDNKSISNLPIILKLLTGRETKDSHQLKINKLGSEVQQLSKGGSLLKVKTINNLVPPKGRTSFDRKDIFSKYFGINKKLEKLIPNFSSVLNLLSKKKTKDSDRDNHLKLIKSEGGLIQHFQDGGSVLKEINTVTSLTKGRTVLDLSGIRELFSKFFESGKTSNNNMVSRLPVILKLLNRKGSSQLKTDKVDGGLIQHFQDGGQPIGTAAPTVKKLLDMMKKGKIPTSGSGSGGFLSKLLGSGSGAKEALKSGAISAAFAIGLALLGRLFAKKQPKSDPDRTPDPYGLNPDTLTFYKKPIIRGVRTYLAKGGDATQSFLELMKKVQLRKVTTDSKTLPNSFKNNNELKLLKQFFAKQQLGRNLDILSPNKSDVGAYLAEGGLVSSNSLMESVGGLQMARGGFVNSDVLDSLGVGKSSDQSVHQSVKVNITTPDIHSFRKSKSAIEKEFGRIAKKGIARHRGRL